MLDWLDMMKNSVEVTTYANYTQTIKNKIIPYFDAHFPTLTLSQLTPKHIQDYYTWEMTKNNVSANTVIHRHANIRKALQYAFKTGLIDILTLRTESSDPRGYHLLAASTTTKNLSSCSQL